MRPTFRLFGLDVYLLAFLVLGGAFVLFAVYYIFFSDAPIPVYCGGRASGAHVCGYIVRAAAVHGS